MSVCSLWRRGAAQGGTAGMEQPGSGGLHPSKFAVDESDSGVLVKTSLVVLLRPGKDSSMIRIHLNGRT